MKILVKPERRKWAQLIKRPVFNQEELNKLAGQIFLKILQTGDTAVRKYTSLFDKVDLENFAVSESEISESGTKIPEALKEAILLAKQNIEKFHSSQRENVNITETMKGVRCWRESRAIDKIGLYIPGGSAPLFSTVLMLGIPASLAGCREIVLCSPPGSNGKIHPAVLYAAQLSGITSVFSVGGMQAIGAMALGCESIPRVDKIFGPGNQYVTAAKQIALNYGVAIDMPAGPSEVLVIADKTCVPSYVAADLLSQAEHSDDSQVVLLSDEMHVCEGIINEVQNQLLSLPRHEIAVNALRNSLVISFGSIAECVEFSNLYAPEHLILAGANASGLIPHINNAGSVFVGNLSCESAGDYASGTNHTLPTNGFARNFSGVSLDSFMKKITFQEINEEGLVNIGPAIEIMAEAEGLYAHKNAVSVRLKNICNV